MSDFLARLKQRKLVQWALAYVAAAFALIQVLDVVSDSYGWPHAVMHIVFGLLVLGFVVTVILAWYHGERGAQRISGPELLLIALVLAVGGGLLWHFARGGSSATATSNMVVSARSPGAAQRNPGNSADSVAGATSSGLRMASAQVVPIPAKSVAVLPFENLSDDKNNAYFADGIQDEILTGLAKIGDLKVISRTSTQQYASKPGNLSDIARQLGVANILEGSVQKEANEVRINVQLIDARSDNHIWAQTYDRKLDDVFAVESEVAQKIATSLQAKITQDERTALTTKPTDSPVAYAAYLKALALAQRSSYGSADVEATIAAYQNAVDIDPDFALAWAGIVKWNSWLYWQGDDPGGTRLGAAKTALDRALDLAPTLPQVELARAWYLYYGTRDFAAALTSFQAAQKGLPNDAQVWQGTGLVERRLGRWDAAVADLQRAHELSPNDQGISSDFADVLIALHRLGEARAVIDTGLALKTDDTELLDQKAYCLWNGNDDPTMVERALASAPASALATGNLALQALYQRHYAQAGEGFRRAIADSGKARSEHSFSEYLPAAVDFHLHWALSEDRLGSSASAAALYRQVQMQARAALSAKPANVNTAVAWHVAAGLAAAGLGQRDEAVAEGRRAVALMPEAKDAADGPRWQGYLARIYATNGDAGHALPIITRLLDTIYPEPLTTRMLRIDPVWDPIRKDPRFEALLKKHGRGEPAVTASETAHG